MPIRRVLWLVPVLLIVTAGYSAWLGWQVRTDLATAERAGRELQSGLESGAPAPDRDRTLADLQVAAGTARDRTSGAWWGAMTHLPLVGDDAAGVRALSYSLAGLAEDGVPPLVETLDRLDGLTSDGRIQVDAVDRSVSDVTAASQAFDRAAADVEDVDSSGFAGSMRGRFEEYVDLVTDADRALVSAVTAARVLPGMVGGDGPRDYLMVFQNNAEIRATGGMPGSWALVHADDGKLNIEQQGTAGSFPMRATPVLPMSRAELAVYDTTMGVYFQSANFTPDFPRAAELWHARWDEVFPATELDGVISLDPVAMSYLLRGAGPIQVKGRTLTADNAVDELLSRPYLELDPAEQNDLFAAVARALFNAMTGDLADPLEFVKGMSRAADEGRLLVAPFDEAERGELAGTRVLGELSGDDGDTPHVDIGLNDATASKLSYYLRYGAEVRAQTCLDGVQMLRGSMSLSQSIPPSEAAQLPDSVTGGGIYGNDVGDQLVFVRIYGPYGGTVEDIRMDGRALDPAIVDLDGRPVATLIVQLSTTRDVVINWAMETGEGQTGDGQLGMTPSVVPGNNDADFGSVC